MNDFQKPGFGLFAGTSLLTVTLWARRAAYPRPHPPLPMPTPTHVAPPLACTPRLRARHACPTLPYPRSAPAYSRARARVRAALTSRARRDPSPP